MRNSLGKTEILGLVLLAVLIVAITGCALLVKGCGETREGSLQPAGVKMEVLDALELPVDTKSHPGGVSSRKVKGVKKSRRGSKKSKTKKNAGNGVTRDPFADTVPLYR